MELRKKLTALFLLLIASLIIGSSLVIYFWFAEYRKAEFYDRMDKKARSVVKLLIDVDEVDAKLLKKIEATEPVALINDQIVIYNNKNQIVYTNDTTPYLATISQLNRIRTEKTIQFNDHDYEILGFYFKGNLDSAVVIISAKDVYGLSKLSKLRLILIIVSCSSIVLVYFSGLFFVGKALNPVSTIIKQVDTITVSNLNQRLSEGNKKDDLAQIALTFNKMLQRLETSFVIQRVFIANASHELRTPLTIITGQLEIALLKARKNEEYITIIKSVLDDIIDVNQLANRLLLIAQANSGYDKIEKSIIRIDEIIWEVRQNVRKISPNYVITVLFNESQIAEENLTVYGNHLLLKIAILNLIENACKYSSDNSVSVFVEIHKPTIQIRFVDKGLGISPEDLEMIFEPFYRGKNTIGIRGHGIGLALVQNIISVHNGQLKVKSNLNVGSEFSIILPIYNEKI